MGLTGGNPRPQSSHKLRILQCFKGITVIMKRNATAITQNPYIDLVESDDNNEDDNQPDVRIFQAPPGYPFYLQPKDKVKARNGYIFTKFDKERKKNITNCSYERPFTIKRKLRYVWKKWSFRQMLHNMRGGRQRASTGLPKRGSTRITLTLPSKKGSQQHTGSF